MKIKLLFATTLALYIGATFSACEKEPVTSYEDVKHIISTSCAVLDCHNSITAESNVEFTNYATMSGQTGRRNVLNKNDNNFYDKVFVEQSMPPLGTLPQADLDLLERWANDGFKESN